MKRIQLLIILIFIGFLQSCSIPNEPYDGKWVTQRFIFKLDLSCDCTENRKSEIERFIRSVVNEELYEKGKNSYLLLTPDFAVEGAIFDEKFTGTYEGTSGEIYLILDGENEKERLQTLRVGGELFFIRQLPQDILNELTTPAKYKEMYNMDLTITDPKIVLEKVK